MRIHALENVQRAIDFLHEKKVPMENIGNHDIVDGNHRIILGLIWTIILRFQVNYRFLTIFTTFFIFFDVFDSKMTQFYFDRIGVKKFRAR